VRGERVCDSTRSPLRVCRSPFTVHRLPFTLLPLTSHLLLLTACTLPPLRGKIDVGRDPYVVFVGGTGPRTDLYAVRADGGPVIPITYTPVAELGPALAPDGSDLAFLRSQSLNDSTPGTVWVMNLRNGTERELELPEGAGPPEEVGWSQDGESLIVRTGQGLYRLNAGPGRPDAQPVPRVERAAAESSLAVLLGDPVFTRVVPCARPRDLCVVGRRGTPRILAQAARDPVRWGPDSVAFYAGGRVQIRPLARGRPRLLLWANPPERPRGLTFFEGKR
jgi:hypothetical protein